MKTIQYENQKELKEFLDSIEDTKQNIQNMMNVQMKEFHHSSVTNIEKKE